MTMDDEHLKHSHRAQPVQPDSGFAEGEKTKPLEEQEPDFARGERTGPEIEDEDRPRFSEGQEETPPTPEKEAERRFSEGQEED
jgi:hypothetical protein